MAKRILRKIESITSLFGRIKKIKLKGKRFEPLKAFTFMLSGEEISKSVNINAYDKASAEEKVKALYPGLKVELLITYTFMISGEGVSKSVNVDAPDKASAEEMAKGLYPGLKVELLWEWKT